MPNKNYDSKFLDQQFIQVIYEGNTNLLPIDDTKTLDFTVKFLVENILYQIIYVGKNQKNSAPVNAPIKEGYKFKNWCLNDEIFDFSTPITKDITLVAEFEERSSTEFSEVLTYTSDGDTYSAHSESDISGLIESLDLSKKYKLDIPGLSPIEGQTLSETELLDASSIFTDFDKVWIAERQTEGVGSVGDVSIMFFKPAVTQGTSEKSGGYLPVGATAYVSILGGDLFNFSEGPHLTELKEETQISNFKSFSKSKFRSSYILEKMGLI